MLSDMLGSAPLTPTAVHYFHATRLHNPELVLEHGLQPSQRSGSLVCDELLRPALYSAQDHLAAPMLDVAQRFTDETTPCIVEYRRRPARNGQDIDAALWFVAASLRGAVSPWAIGGHDTNGAPIAGHDIVSVRAIRTQHEWTAKRPPR